MNIEASNLIVINDKNDTEIIKTIVANRGNLYQALQYIDYELVSIFNSFTSNDITQNLVDLINVDLPGHLLVDELKKHVDKHIFRIKHKLKLKLVPKSIINAPSVIIYSSGKREIIRIKKSTFISDLLSIIDRLPKIPDVPSFNLGSNYKDNEEYISRNDRNTTFCKIEQDILKLPISQKETLLLSIIKSEVYLEKNYGEILANASEKIPLSPLVFTNNFEFIVSCPKKEISLNFTNREKAIYLLFLKYRPGIRIKELINHKNELFDLYTSLNMSVDKEQAARTINNVVNPVENSFSQACSKIGKKFRTIFSSEIAKKYCISGPNGKQKRIPLDRSLISINSKYFKVKLNF